MTILDVSVNKKMEKGFVPSLLFQLQGQILR